MSLPGSANSAACSAGTNGAPWPPAATSRLRKSQTTSMPHSSERAVHQLQRVAGAVELLRPMAHGLAVGADRAHLRRRHAALAQQGVHHVGIDAHQSVGREGATVQLIVAGCVQAQQLGTQPLRQRSEFMGPQPHCAAIVWPRVELGEHAIDAVQRAAGHQPDEQAHRGATARTVQRHAAAGQGLRQIELQLRAARQRGKARARRAVDADRIGGFGQAQRIDVLTIDLKLEVQMRPGGPAGGADRAEALALFDGLALVHVDACRPAP